MRVTYIGHSGFLVETGESCYLFDYYRGGLPPLTRGKPVIVFASHSHSDHYNPEVFALLREQGVTPCLAVLSGDIPRKRWPEGVEVLCVHAREVYDLPDGARVETLLSTDKGVAYLVGGSEGNIYHAGDLNDWVWEGEPEEDNRQMTGMYRKELERLAGREIKAAFLPLDPRQEQHYARGMLRFLERVGAEVVYPMHYGNDPGIIRQFLRDYPQYVGVIKDTENAKGEIV